MIMEKSTRKEIVRLILINLVSGCFAVLFFFFLKEAHVLNMILYIVIQMLGLESLDETFVLIMFDILISVGCANVLFRSLKKRYLG